MGTSAASIEKSIDEAVLKCTSLRAIGLWFKMFKVIKANRTTGEPCDAQFAISLDRIASMVGKSNATHQERRDYARRIISPLRRIRVDNEPLIQRRDREYLSLPLFRAALERYRVQTSVKALRNAEKRYVTPNGGHTPEHANSPCNGEGLALRNAQPPMVFPPDPPLSLPPNSLSAREGKIRPDLPQLPDDSPDPTFQNALAAFSLWSRHYRSRDILPMNNEDRPIRELLQVVSQNPPIILRSGVAAKQGDVVPLAVETLIANNTAFKNPAFACGCVKNLLAEWQISGGPGAKIEAQRNGKRRASAPAPTKSKIIDYSPELKGTHE